MQEPAADRPGTAGRRHRTLFISDIAPQPHRFGGAMRVDAVTQELARYGRVDLLLLRYEPPVEPLPAMVFDRVHVVDLSPADHPDGDRIAVDRLAPDRRRVLDQLPAWLHDESYDLVWYNRERCFLRAEGITAAPSVIDIDDREEVLLRRWAQLGQSDTGAPLSEQSAARIRRDAQWWAAAHERTARAADLLLVSSDADRDTFGHHSRVLVLPNTYQPEPGHVPATACGPRRPVLLFPASLTWAPNEDAAAWLVAEIAPLVRARVPELRIVLAGRASKRVCRLGESAGVEVTGEVPSMLPYLRSAGAVAVPLRVGGGTRIKILEAFANRVPVVATSIGAEGLHVRDGVHLNLADRAEEFAAACVRLLTDQATADRLTAAGHDLFEQRYRPDHAAARVREALRYALATHDTAEAR